MYRRHGLSPTHAHGLGPCDYVASFISFFVTKIIKKLMIPLSGWLCMVLKGDYG